MKGQFAIICKALARVGLFSPVIREMELWDVGVLIGGDEAPPPPRLILPNDSRDPDAPPPSGPRLADVD